MDKVEFVSPVIPKWNALTNHKNSMHQNTPMHHKLDYQQTDRGADNKFRAKERANNNFKILQKPLLAVFRQLVPEGFQDTVLPEESQLLMEKLAKSNPVVIQMIP